MLVVFVLHARGIFSSCRAKITSDFLMTISLSWFSMRNVPGSIPGFVYYKLPGEDFTLFRTLKYHSKQLILAGAGRGRGM